MYTLSIDKCTDFTITSMFVICFLIVLLFYCIPLVYEIIYKYIYIYIYIYIPQIKKYKMIHAIIIFCHSLHFWRLFGILLVCMREM